MMDCPEEQGLVCFCVIVVIKDTPTPMTSKESEKHLSRRDCNDTEEQIGKMKKSGAEADRELRGNKTLRPPFQHPCPGRPVRPRYHMTLTPNMDWRFEIVGPFQVTS